METSSQKSFFQRTVVSIKPSGIYGKTLAVEKNRYRCNRVPARSTRTRTVEALPQFRRVTILICHPQNGYNYTVKETHHHHGAVCHVTFVKLLGYTYFLVGQTRVQESPQFLTTYLRSIPKAKYGEKPKRRVRRHFHDACTYR